jgi:hypothetical protein
MFFPYSYLFWVVILTHKPTVRAGVAWLFPLLSACQVQVKLEMMMCGACVTFDVSLLAMEDITGAFSKSFAAGNLAPVLDEWRKFLQGFGHWVHSLP